SPFPSFQRPQGPVAPAHVRAEVRDAVLERETRGPEPRIAVDLGADLPEPFQRFLRVASVALDEREEPLARHLVPEEQLQQELALERLVLRPLLEPSPEGTFTRGRDAIQALVGSVRLLNLALGGEPGRHQTAKLRVDLALRRRPEELQAALGQLHEVVARGLSEGEHAEHRERAVRQSFGLGGTHVPGAVVQIEIVRIELDRSVPYGLAGRAVNLPRPSGRESASARAPAPAQGQYLPYPPPEPPEPDPAPPPEVPGVPDVVTAYQTPSRPWPFA